MVTFKAVGRAGNFLFEAACCIAYATKHGLEFTVPDRTNNPKWNPVYFQHLVNRKLNPRLPAIVIKEDGHAYQELPFVEGWRGMNIILDGYFQSEKYFTEYRKEVLSAFNIPYQRNEGTVSIHVRRGDYLQLPEKHPAVTIDWYMDAVRYFLELGYKKFMVFSDDIPWCKENFIGQEFSFSEGNRELKDLELMANCEGHINSSSTFSWWGAWLNRYPHKMAITPKHWFVLGHGGLDTSDIIPENWIKL